MPRTKRITASKKVVKEFANEIDTLTKEIEMDGIGFLIDNCVQLKCFNFSWEKDITSHERKKGMFNGSNQMSE